MTHVQDAEFFSLSSSLSSSLLPSFILPLLSFSLPSSLPSLPSSLPLFLSAFCCLLIMKQVARHHVKTWRVSPWGSLSSGPPFLCKPSRGWLLFTPVGWTLYCLVFSPVSTHTFLPSTHRLWSPLSPPAVCTGFFFFFVFIATQVYLQFEREGGGTLAVVRGLLTVVASLTADMVLVAPRHVGSSWIRDQTHFSHIGRRIPYHWATKEGPCLDLSAPLNYLPISFKV